MHPELLDSVARRDGLHVFWFAAGERPRINWIRQVATQLSSDGPVVLLDFLNILPQLMQARICILDERIHQGSPDRKDDMTSTWEKGIHILPTGVSVFPDAIEHSRLRHLLVNLQLLREQFRHTLVLLPREWNAAFDAIVGASSSWTVFSDTNSHDEVVSTLAQAQRGKQVPFLWVGEPLSPADGKRIGRRPFFASGLREIYESPELLALQLREARRFHILQKNPPENWVRVLQRFWWVFGLALASLVFVIPLSLDSPQSLFRDLASEKRLYAGKPFFQFRFNGQVTAQRLAKHAIGRFTSLVPAESEVHDYLVETLRENHQDSLKWTRDAGGALTPPEGTTLRFYPPNQLFNPEADSLMPAWRFFVSMLSDSLAYVTEYYNPTGRGGGRRHAGIDIAGRHGTRILAPFSGKAWTTYDERGGVVIALVHEKSVLLFMHCDQLLYMDGQEVIEGDPLATVGMTGHTTGPHVHFVAGKVSSNGLATAGPVRYNTVDPVRWVFDSAIKLRETH